MSAKLTGALRGEQGRRASPARFIKKFKGKEQQDGRVREFGTESGVFLF